MSFESRNPDGYSRCHLQISIYNKKTNISSYMHLLGSIELVFIKKNCWIYLYSNSSTERVKIPALACLGLQSAWSEG